MDAGEGGVALYVKGRRPRGVGKRDIVVGFVGGFFSAGMGGGEVSAEYVWSSR